MPTLTLDQIDAIADRRYAEANAPADVATRAIETLVSALAECSARECGEILDLLRQEIQDAALCPILA